MKNMYAALIAIVTGITGFAAGGGLGLLGGATAGSVVGGFAGGVLGSATGMCMTVDEATKQGILTSAEVEKIGIGLGKNLKSKGASIDNISVEGQTESCQKLIQGIAKGTR